MTAWIRSGSSLHPLLDEAGERREHQRAVEAQLVHELEAGRGVAERGDGLHRLADDLAVALALGLPCRKYSSWAPGRATTSNVGFGMYSLICVAHHDLGAAADLDVVDGALVVVRQELRERLLRLVEVVVGVEHRIGELAGWHCASWKSCSARKW